MKKIILMAVISVFLASCSMPSNNWVYPDTIVKENNNYKASLSIPCTQVMGAKQCTGFIVTIQNKTNNPIKIVWNDTIVVKGDTSDGVLPDGVRFIEKDKAKQDTIVPKKLKISKTFTPISNVYWSPELRGWTYYLLSPGEYKVYVELIVNGKNKTQEFSFNIIDNNPK